MWGGATWMQNTRGSYWPMLGSGDYEQLLPYFRWMRRQIPLAEARSNLWYGTLNKGSCARLFVLLCTIYCAQPRYGHGGAFFPETHWSFGTYKGSDFGCDRSSPGPSKRRSFEANNFVRHHLTGTLEVSPTISFWPSRVKRSCMLTARRADARLLALY